MNSATQVREGSYIYGIYNDSDTPFTITMDGEKVIEVTDTGMTTADDKSAWAGGAIRTNVTGSGVKINVTATGGTSANNNASAYAEIRKLYGNVNSNVNYSVGARWAF